MAVTREDRFFLVTDLADDLVAHYDELASDARPYQHAEAWDKARDLVRGDAERGWGLVVELIERVPPAGVTYLAAGPLEDFIDFHPEAAVERIEANRANGKLVAALSRVIVGPWVPRPMVERLRSVAPSLRYADDK